MNEGQSKLRRRGFTKWAVLILLGLVVLSVAVLLPMLLTPTPAYRAQCQSNLKQVAMGMFQYNQDWDDRFPLVDMNDAAIAAHSPLGWADALQPYLKSTQLFWCPLQIKNGKRDGYEKQPSDRNYTDYFYNRRLAGMDIEKYKAPLNHTILFGEGNDGTDAANARYAMSSLPTPWLKDKDSPLHRHLEGANYAFADDHVKWLKPGKVTNKKPDGTTPTFAIK